ncbi:RNA polymerase sigma factor [Bacteroidota bacterium]
MKLMISDAEIVKGCIEGDRSLQKLLYDKFAPNMLGICSRYFRNIEEAEDALQEGFIRVFFNIKSFRNEGPLEGWIRKVIINTALNYHRSNLKHFFHSDIDELDEMIEDEKAQIKQIEVEDIMKVIQDLPIGYRLVFNLYEIDGYSHKEIAKMLNISKNTSKSQLLKAKKFLQKKLAGLQLDTFNIKY